MAATMKRSEVIKWLESHGGQSTEADGYKVDYIDVPNPLYKESTKHQQPEKVSVKQVTWKAKDGQTLTVIDMGRTADSAPEDPSRDPESHPREPEYDRPEINVAVKEQTPDRSPNATAWTESVAKEKQRQAEDNLRNTGRYETNDERDDRIKAEEKRQDEIRSRDRASGVAERQVSVAEAAEQRAAEKDRRDANKPDVLKPPSSEDKNIAIMGPDGKIQSVANPTYDEALVEAKRKKEELALAIQVNKMTADQAATEYDRWFKQNIEVPFLQSREQRDRAAEQRAALDSEERRRQFASDFGLRKATLGQQAGQDAVSNELALLPYRAGPTEAAEMSSAINSLAKGGSLANDASAGINFTAEAFQFDRPDFEGIAKSATKAAIGHLTNYRPSEDQYQVADYSGIAMPNSETMATAPAMAPQIDTSGIYKPGG